MGEKHSYSYIALPENITALNRMNVRLELKGFSSAFFFLRTQSIDLTSKKLFSALLISCFLSGLTDVLLSLSSTFTSPLCFHLLLLQLVLLLILLMRQVIFSSGCQL